MKVGDLVMFIDEGVYAKWFFGQIGVVRRYTPRGSDGKPHCRVQWLQSIPYHNMNCTISDFAAEKFEVYND